MPIMNFPLSLPSPFLGLTPAALPPPLGSFSKQKTQKKFSGVVWSERCSRLSPKWSPVHSRSSTSRSKSSPLPPCPFSPTPFSLGLNSLASPSQVLYLQVFLHSLFLSPLLNFLCLSHHHQRTLRPTFFPASLVASCEPLWTFLSFFLPDHLSKDCSRTPFTATNRPQHYVKPKVHSCSPFRLPKVHSHSHSY